MARAFSLINFAIRGSIFLLSSRFGKLAYLNCNFNKFSAVFRNLLVIAASSSGRSSSQDSKELSSALEIGQLAPVMDLAFLPFSSASTLTG